VGQDETPGTHGANAAKSISRTNDEELAHDVLETMVERAFPLRMRTGVVGWRDVGVSGLNKSPQTVDAVKSVPGVKQREAHGRQASGQRSHGRAGGVEPTASNR
jgi:hypothetical protein